MRIGQIVKLHVHNGTRYAATHGALARIKGPAFDLPSGKRVIDVEWLDPRTSNGQRDGAYLTHDLIPVEETA